MGIRASRFSRSPSNVAFRCEGNGEAFKGEEVATPDLFLLYSFPRIQENPSSGDSHRQFSFLFFSWNSVCKKKRNIEKIQGAIGLEKSFLRYPLVSVVPPLHKPSHVYVSMKHPPASRIHEVGSTTKGATQRLAGRGNAAS